MKVFAALLLSVFAHAAAFFSVDDDLSPLVFDGGQTAVAIAMNIVEVTTQQAKQKASQPKKTLTKAIKLPPPVSTNFSGNTFKAKEQKSIATVTKNTVHKKELLVPVVEPIEEISPEETQLVELVKMPIPAESLALDNETERNELTDDITQAAQLATAKHHTQQLSLTNTVVDVAAPSLFKAPRPKLIYPKRAKRRGFQGQVFVLIELNAKGAIDKLSLSKSSGYKLLDKAALNNVSQWQFNPVLQHGIAIRARFEVPIGFFLA